MMNIKFRGIPEGENEFVFGDLCTNYEGQPGAVFIIDEDCTYIQVNPQSIGQFTGLYDKNKKEVYNGDIMPYNYSGKFNVVVENWGDGVYRLVSNGMTIEWLHQFSVKGRLKETEVIGNVHTAPNLLT